MRLQLGNIEYDYSKWLKSYTRHLKYQDVTKNTFDVYMRILYNLLDFIEYQGHAKMLTPDSFGHSAD